MILFIGGKRQGQFPNFAGLAKKFLVMQATSAPSERVFAVSVASRIISNCRARLDPTRAALESRTHHHHAYIYICKERERPKTFLPQNSFFSSVKVFLGKGSPR
jgi:hAT family C-terminal dimerisation region